MEKPAPVQFPIHDLLKRRWSPRAFADRPVEPAKLQSLFEAVRWAAICVECAALGFRHRHARATGRFKRI